MPSDVAQSAVQLAVQSTNVNDEGVPASLATGTVLNKQYRIEKLLSQKNPGNSYLATALHTGEKVVLKQIPNSLTCDLATSDLVMISWQIEATLYQAVHPCLPKFLEAFADRNSVFLVRSYVPGIALEKVSGPVLESTLISWLQDILTALVRLHQQGLYHDNIAPENIVISSQSNRPVLINFNCADVLIKRTTQKRVATYPSESFTEEVFISDLYPLAVLAISLLAQVNFQALMTTRNWVGCWEKDVAVSPALAEVLDNMLHLSPLGKYRDAGSCLTALAKLPLEIID